MVDSKADTVTRNNPDDENASASFALENLAGREIAGCEIIRKLGQGAMGAVYLATQLSLRRTVAFKVLDPKFSRDLTYIERFEREAQAAARLTHYNIVQVFDYGRDGDLYYIVNEYVDGGTVQDLIDENTCLDLEQSIDLVMQTCNGLAVAQQNKIMHRDIKPENLMLTKDGVVKIADFGLAKVVDDDATVTQSGMIVGTPFYMSPEQAKGHSLDPRSDIYSLGIAFFYMATGQLPFDADSVIGVLLKQISAERPDPVAINPALPNSVGQVILKMMARDPKDRFQTFTEVITALEQVRRNLGKELDKEPPSMEQEADLPAGDRFDRYKLLRPSRVIRLNQRHAPAEATEKMLAMLKADAGVFLQTKEPMPEKSIVEVRFSVPGRDDIFHAIGIVRWISQDPQKPGMGITFLKVNTLPREVASASSRRMAAASVAGSQPAAKPVSAPKAIKMLTKTPLHCRFLRYVYANSGQSVGTGQISNALGVGNRMLPAVLTVFEQCGLIRRHKSGIIDLLWPEDESLQREVVGWVSKYGLL